MSDNIARIMSTIGIGEDVVGAYFGDLMDEQLEGLVLDEEDVGALITRKIPGVLHDDQLRRVAGAITKNTQGLERVYAGAAAAALVERNLRPNSAVTLYATSVGVPCAAGVLYNLLPRTSGVLETTPFKFTDTMSFWRLMADPIDCANRFALVGGSVGFVDDAARTMPKDTMLSAFRPEVETKDTPLGSLQKRSPTSTVDFTARIYLDAAAGEIFYGLQLLYADSACINGQKRWLDNLADMDFLGLAKSLMATARARFTRGGRGGAAIRGSLLGRRI